MLFMRTTIGHPNITRKEKKRMEIVVTYFDGVLEQEIVLRNPLRQRRESSHPWRSPASKRGPRGSGSRAA
ncbi:hypothetical protein B296_00045431 [Ensete ventricosum]|uniref:Uncharacterized protein n=1 Tax=Ensete ventricosum TaxID=4639 RepID=A0A426Z7F5_ENSVE|nr:hypothetical protein B296_00045431 [Ensete ventricosum]